MGSMLKNKVMSIKTFLELRIFCLGKQTEP